MSEIKEIEVTFGAWPALRDQCKEVMEASVLKDADERWEMAQRVMDGLPVLPATGYKLEASTTNCPAKKPNSYMNLTMEIWWSDGKAGVHFDIGADHLIAERCLIDEYLKDYQGWHQIDLRTIEWDTENREAQLDAVVREYLGGRVKDSSAQPSLKKQRTGADAPTAEIKQLEDERDQLNKRIYEARLRAQPAMLHIHCDSCGTDGPPGYRYACSVCTDFDICQKCNDNDVHNEHAMVQIKHGGQTVGKTAILMVDGVLGRATVRGMS